MKICFRDFDLFGEDVVNIWEYENKLVYVLVGGSSVRLLTFLLSLNLIYLLYKIYKLVR